MVQTVNTRQFSREGKEGTLITIKQRGVTERGARIAAATVAAAKFPIKSTKIAVVGSRKVGESIGPASIYEVDVFVPVKNIGGSQTSSGDISVPDLN